MQNIKGKGTFVMDKGNELMQRQLETQIRESLAEENPGRQSRRHSAGRIGPHASKRNTARNNLKKGPWP